MKPNHHCSDSFLIDRQKISLTEIESDLFSVLYNARGVAVSRDDLFLKVWGATGGPEEKSLDHHIMNLRRKLAATRFRIANVYGRGFKFSRLPAGAPMFAPASMAA